MTQSTLAFPSKRAPQAGSPLRLALELNPDGALVCTGDTAPLKDYLLKPHGFGWDAASGRWRRPGPGGRDAAHRLAAQMQADGQAELTLLDHDPQLPKHSLAAELAQLLPSAASPASCGSQGAAPPSCGGQRASLAHILSGRAALEIRKRRVTSCGSLTNTRRGRQQESNGRRLTQKTQPHS